MRNRLLSIPALLLTLAFTGCDSSSAGGAACESAGLTASGSLIATAGGDGFEAVCLSAQFTSGTLAITGLENIDGSAGATQRQINLTVPRAAAGTFNVDATGAAIASYASVDLANPAAGAYGGISGSITVDAVSAAGASGSFAFTGRNSAGTQIQVAGGAFDVEF